MSIIKIRQTTIVNLTTEEMDTILFCRRLQFLPTQKGIKFLKWIKDKMAYGQCQVISKDGQPVRIERAIESELFNFDAVEKLGA